MWYKSEDRWTQIFEKGTKQIDPNKADRSELEFPSWATARSDGALSIPIL